MILPCFLDMETIEPQREFLLKPILHLIATLIHEGAQGRGKDSDKFLPLHLRPPQPHELRNPDHKVLLGSTVSTSIHQMMCWDSILHRPQNSTFFQPSFHRGSTICLDKIHDIRRFIITSRRSLGKIFVKKCLQTLKC